MKIKQKLYQFKAEGRAILAANFYNFETLSGILQAAHELNEPVMLQLSEFRFSNFCKIPILAPWENQLPRALLNLKILFLQEYRLNSF